MILTKAIEKELVDFFKEEQELLFYKLKSFNLSHEDKEDVISRTLLKLLRQRKISYPKAVFNRAIINEASSFLTRLKKRQQLPCMAKDLSDNGELAERLLDKLSQDELLAKLSQDSDFLRLQQLQAIEKKTEAQESVIFRCKRRLRKRYRTSGLNAKEVS